MFSSLTGVPLPAVMALDISQATTPLTEGEDSKICSHFENTDLPNSGFKVVLNVFLALKVCQVVLGQRRVVLK